MPSHSSSHHHPLRIVPKELVFPAPLNRVITNILKLHNVSTSPIAYKVKTTAPQRYCVRPNNGVLPPGETIEVQVLLNYVKDAPPNPDVKDKFQIQSIVLTGSLGNISDIAEVWTKATNEQIIKQKLKARFTTPSTNNLLKPPQPTSLSTSHSEPNITTTPAVSNSNLTTSPSAPTPPFQPTILNTSTTSTLMHSSTHANPINAPDTITNTTTINVITTATPTATPTLTLTPTLIPIAPAPSTVPTTPILTLAQETDIQDAHTPLPIQTQQQPKITSPVSPQIPLIPQTNEKQRPNILSSQNSLVDSSEHAFLTPMISVRSESKPKEDVVPLSLEHKPRSEPQPKIESNRTEILEPKPTGDYVADTVASVSTLRKTLEQMASLKGDNQRLNDQVKSLADQLHRSKEETGLRQRTIQSTSPAIVSRGPSALATSHLTPQESLIQIQLRVLLFVILFFAFMGFLLGRYTR